MAKRLIQRFLHWLRLQPSQISGAKHYHLLTIPNHQNHNATRLTHLPNPASSRAANASNFRVLLSNHQYSPSHAVQSLNYQLSHPQSRTTSTSDLLTSENIFFQKHTDRLAMPQPAQENLQQASQLTSSETFRLSQTDKVNIHLSVTPPSTKGTSHFKTEQNTSPVDFTLQPTVASITHKTVSKVITKQGVVKLLFKVKRNNYHGYIAPNDGSKDIIFHQKYIGNDVFCQLERGMAVEVTAHITEGKAYADHVRII